MLIEITNKIWIGKNNPAMFLKVRDHLLSKGYRLFSLGETINPAEVTSIFMYKDMDMVVGHLDRICFKEISAVEAELKEEYSLQPVPTPLLCFDGFPESSYTCPNCGSVNLSEYKNKKMDKDIDVHYRQFHCCNCGKHFESEYRITKIREYRL